MYITRKKQRYYCGNFASSVLNTMVLVGILFLIKVVCGTFIFKAFSVGSFVVSLGVFLVLVLLYFSNHNLAKLIRNVT